MTITKKHLMIGLVLVLALIAAQGVTAQGDEVIYGCYHEKNGKLRIVETSEDCKRKEIPVWWNVTGPEGPPGAPGLLSEVTRYCTPTDETRIVSCPVDAGCEKIIKCPLGTVAVGGGGGSHPNQFYMVINGPTDDNGWTVRMRATGEGPVETALDVCVLCATVAE